MATTGNWCLIESDPGVFTELIKGFGAEGLECEEVYDLKEIEQINDAFGLIFLFKWEANKKEYEAYVSDVKSKGIFFAKQVITNACATQAILNILLNIKNAEVKLGNVLNEFKSFVEEFDCSMKGTALSNSQHIRTIHNSFSNFQLFEFDESHWKRPDDVYHFVGYIPIDGVLYELDGLKDGPIDHGRIPEGTTWVSLARPVLEERMSKFSGGNFNLMAVVPERLSLYGNQLRELTSVENMPPAELKFELERKIDKERRKMATYREENNRRRHNYIPLIVELLKLLGENGYLVDSINKAKTSAEQIKSTNMKTGSKKQ